MSGPACDANHQRPTLRVADAAAHASGPAPYVPPMLPGGWPSMMWDLAPMPARASRTVRRRCLWALGGSSGCRCAATLARTGKGEATGDALGKDHDVGRAVHDVLMSPPLARAAHARLHLHARDVHQSCCCMAMLAEGGACRHAHARHRPAWRRTSSAMSTMPCSSHSSRTHLKKPGGGVRKPPCPGHMRPCQPSVAAHGLAIRQLQRCMRAMAGPWAHTSPMMGSMIIAAVSSGRICRQRRAVNPRRAVSPAVHRTGRGAPAGAAGL